MTDILITLSPKEIAFSSYLPRNIGMFYCFGGFSFSQEPSAEKHPATVIKYMLGDINCSSSYNKHEWPSQSDHSIWPLHYKSCTEKEPFTSYPN